MEIKKLVDYVNRGYIASDYLREPDIYYYMDMVIDDINERLQSRYPTFSEWETFVAAWNLWVGRPQPILGEGLPPEPPEPPHPKHHNPYWPQCPHHPHNSPYGPHLPIEHAPWEHPKPMFLRDRTKYDAFPDEYLRTVVALGVAVKFYTRDEEGEQIAMDYQNRYEAALFKMVRDFHNRVPWYFQDNTGGFIDFSYNREEGPWDLVPRGVVLRGKDTKVL